MNLSAFPTKLIRIWLILKGSPIKLLWIAGSIVQCKSIPLFWASYINKLEINVAYPFLMKVYDDYDKKIINKDDFVMVLELIQ